MGLPEQPRSSKCKKAGELTPGVHALCPLQEWNVLTVPGRGFGTPGHFRISYCVEDRVLEGAINGFARATSSSTPS